MLKNLLRSSLLSFLLVSAWMAGLAPENIQAQDQYLTFKVSLAYTTPYANRIPAPLTFNTRDFCDVKNVRTEVTYNLLAGAMTYNLVATITAPYFLTGHGDVGINCPLRLDGTSQELLIDGFVYSPLSGQIVSDVILQGSPLLPNQEVAYQTFVDTSTPGHYIYHFRGNDALFALAQQTFGVNFTGVELLFDVQAPS